MDKTVIFLHKYLFKITVQEIAWPVMGKIYILLTHTFHGKNIFLVTILEHQGGTPQNNDTSMTL